MVKKKDIKDNAKIAEAASTESAKLEAVQLKEKNEEKGRS